MLNKTRRPVAWTRPDDLSHTRKTTLPFLLLAFSPFIMSDSDDLLILCRLCKSKTLWNIFMILGRNVEQDQMTCHLQNDNSAFLTFGIISLSYVWQWLSIDSCLLCKSKTLWNILMILGSNEGQDQTTCHIQEWQLRLFLLLKLSTRLVFEIDFLSLLCKTNTLWNILMMLGTNVKQDKMTCCIQEWKLAGLGGDICFFLKNLF